MSIVIQDCRKCNRHLQKSWFNLQTICKQLSNITKLFANIALAGILYARISMFMQAWFCKLLANCPKWFYRSIIIHFLWIKLIAIFMTSFLAENSMFTYFKCFNNVKTKITEKIIMNNIYFKLSLIYHHSHSHTIIW